MTYVIIILSYVYLDVCNDDLHIILFLIIIQNGW